jgi:hypothetical protein
MSAAAAEVAISGGVEAGAGAGAPTTAAAATATDTAAHAYPVEKFDVPYAPKYSSDDLIDEGAKTITFTTKEGTRYKISMEYFRPSAMISNFIEDAGDADEADEEADEDNTFALSQVPDKMIPVLFDFLKMQRTDPLQKIPEEKINRYVVKTPGDVIKQPQYVEFVEKVFKAGLIFDLILLGNYLCISELEDLGGFYVAFLYKSHHYPEKVLAAFGVSTDTMDESQLKELEEMKTTFKEYIDY